MSKTFYKIKTGKGTRFEYWVDKDESNNVTGGVFVGSRGDLSVLTDEELDFFRRLPDNPTARDFDPAFTTGCAELKVE